MENEAWPLPFVNAHTTAVIEDDVVLHPHSKFLQHFKKEYNIYLIPSDEISAYLRQLPRESVVRTEGVAAPPLVVVVAVVLTVGQHVNAAAIVAPEEHVLVVGQLAQNLHAAANVLAVPTVSSRERKYRLHRTSTTFWTSSHGIRNIQYPFLN